MTSYGKIKEKTKELVKMADTAAHKAWMKENTLLFSVRLQKSTDSDIIEYLEGKNRGTEIKKALRLLIEAEKKKGE